jgi:hypothetical protein
MALESAGGTSNATNKNTHIAGGHLFLDLRASFSVSVRACGGPSSNAGTSAASRSIFSGAGLFQAVNNHHFQLLTRLRPLGKSK